MTNHRDSEFYDGYARGHQDGYDRGWVDGWRQGQAAALAAVAALHHSDREELIRRTHEENVAARVAEMEAIDVGAWLDECVARSKARDAAAVEAGKTPGM